VTQTKTVGVIGGMGPAATADFFRRVVALTEASCDQDHLHVVIDSDPAIPDRTLALVDDGPSPVPHLVRVARRLEAMGADLVVMPCNTAHAFADEVARAVAIPLVGWVTETVAHVAARNPRPVAAGILATTGTIVSGVYQDALQAAGIAPVVPSGTEQAAVMAAIYGLKGGDALQPAVALAARSLVARGAEVLLLACTELPELELGADVPVVDPADVVARRVVALAGGTPRRTATAA
jgi:aspartate racemase